LNRRGKIDAPIIGKEMYRKGIFPDLILCSSALRTRQTLSAMQHHYPMAKIAFKRDLYHSSAEYMLQLVKSVPDNIDTVLLVVHNPGITSAFELFGNVRIDNVPTCGAGCFSFDVDSFSIIMTGTGNLEYFLYPKGL
jgi:phosphohistidine phosphatase